MAEPYLQAIAHRSPEPSIAWTGNPMPSQRLLACR